MNLAETNLSFRVIKDELANRTLFGLFLIIVPAVITSIFRFIFQGWQIVYYWHIAAGIIVIITWVFRKHISFEARSAILIMLFYITGLSGYYSYGLFSFASVYFIMCILFTVILFGYKPAFVATAVCFASLFIFYAAIHYGWLVYKIDFNKHHQLFSSWLTIMVTFLMFSVMITLLVGKLHEKLNETLDNSKISEEKFRKIFENSGDAINVSKNGLHVMMNDTFLKMYCYESSEELIGKPIIELFEDNSRDQISEYISNRQNGLPVPIKYVNKGVRKNGEVFDFEVFVTNYDWNKEKYTLAIIRDISEQLKFQKELIKAKEKAEESDRLKSAFLANMSHEIRTPMNAIIGFSEFLLKPDFDEQKKGQFVKLIQQKSYELLQIIEDILDVSKIEVGQMKLSVTEFKLKEFLNELFNFYNQKIMNLTSKSDIRLKLSISDELKNISIISDNYRLKQILNNLLDNSLKFTESGYIEIGCRWNSNTSLLFFVSDTGIGIAPEKNEIIFDRFRQAEETVTAKKYGGTGLGLSIVKGIVEQFNGKIWLDSELGKGTTFYFTIPIVINEIPYNNLEEYQDLLTPKWLNKTVLIVEDDETNTEYLKEMLSETGLHILNAYDGNQTIRILERNLNIDLVFMDIRLPDTNGLVLTKTIRKKFPNIIIVAQTAYATPNDLQECLDAGCHDFISKPINSKKLFSIIGYLFEKKMEKLL